MSSLVAGLRPPPRVRVSHDDPLAAQRRVIRALFRRRQVEALGCTGAVGIAVVLTSAEAPLVLAARTPSEVDLISGGLTAIGSTLKSAQRSLGDC